MNSDIDFSKILPLVKPLKPFAGYLVILAVLGVFGYTGWIINASFSPQPADITTANTGRVVFDKATIEKVKNLDQVNISSGGSSLGDSTTSPFGN